MIKIASGIKVARQVKRSYYIGDEAAAKQQADFKKSNPKAHAARQAKAKGSAAFRAKNKLNSVEDITSYIHKQRGTSAPKSV